MNFIMVEDHNLVRQGVSKIIEEKSSFKCEGTFSGVTETKAFLAQYIFFIKPLYQFLISSLARGSSAFPPVLISKCR